MKSSREAQITPKDNRADVDRIVPTDILLKVFGYLGGGYTTAFTTRKPPPGVHYSQLIRAASVCQRWRHLVHTTSSFWSRIFIVESDGDALFHFLKWQIGLTQQQPLHISNRVYSPQDMFSGDTISLLLGCSHRWASLNLTCPLPIMEKLLSSAPMPSLTTLHFRSVRESTPKDERCLLMTTDAPRLTHVALRNIDKLSFILPWGQLKTFSFDTSSVFQFLPFLHDVERLTTYWKEGDFASAWKQPNINLPRLRHVDLECYDTWTFLNGFQKELQSLPSPGVESVGILLFGQTSAMDLALLKQPLIPFALTRLHIRHYFASSGFSLLKVLCSLPLLQHFLLDDGEGTDVDGLLDGLHDTTGILPALKELTLHFVRFSMEKGRRMVDVRVGTPKTIPASGRHLQTVHIAHYRDQGPDDGRTEVYSPQFMDGNTTVYLGKYLPM